MRAILDLVLVPLIGAYIGGSLAGPAGMLLGLVVGVAVGGEYGRRRMKKDNRIAELEQRVEELEND